MKTNEKLLLGRTVVTTNSCLCLTRNGEEISLPDGINGDILDIGVANNNPYIVFWEHNVTGFVAWENIELLEEHYEYPRKND